MLAPGLVDAERARFGIQAARTDTPEPGGTLGNLDAPRPENSHTEGQYDGQARRFSLYTWMETHPPAKVLATGGALAGAALLLARRGGRNGPGARYRRTR